MDSNEKPTDNNKIKTNIESLFSKAFDFKFPTLEEKVSLLKEQNKKFEELTNIEIKDAVRAYVINLIDIVVCGILNQIYKLLNNELCDVSSNFVQSQMNLDEYNKEIDDLLTYVISKNIKSNDRYDVISAYKEYTAAIADVFNESVTTNMFFKDDNPDGYVKQFIKNQLNPAAYESLTHYIRNDLTYIYKFSKEVDFSKFDICRMKDELLNNYVNDVIVFDILPAVSKDDVELFMRIKTKVDKYFQFHSTTLTTIICIITTIFIYKLYKDGHTGIADAYLFRYSLNV